jgi:quercetin dioxygenase-like cupin family protein
MHYSSNLSQIGRQTPPLYAKRSSGFTRTTTIDRTVGSVHMGVGVCELAPAGCIDPHVHTFEESFILLEGQVIVQVGERAHLLSRGDYGVVGTGISHGWRNVSDQPVRWLEAQAPQPRPIEYGRDTFFVEDKVPLTAAPIDLSNSENNLFGHFDESQLPRPGGPSQMEGFNPTTGVAIKMFVDRSFGAIHQSLFLIQYQPGAKIDPHDHTFEESYLIVSGRVRATADGEVYDLGPGDVIWTGVGCLHSFANVGEEPVRWIETQAPLPPAKEVFRFERDWAQFAANDPVAP